jgi:prolyl-tRNA synthetase
MKYSKAFLFTQRSVSQQIEAISYDLSIRAGLIHQVSSGLYDLLPVAQKVLNKISAIVKEEMDRAGALEISMPIAQPVDLWEESGRWGVYGEEMLKFKNREGKEYCLGPTHEEMICDLVRPYLSSYKQLPFNLYQLGMKFRDEMRPRYGLQRTREFVMKDAYSFHGNSESLNETYMLMREAYQTIFRRLDLEVVPTEADPGEMGGSASEEFLAIAGSGESKFVFSDNGKAVQIDDINESTSQDVLTGIEVGHIFQLGDKYTKVMNLKYTDADGVERIPLMGCYGIGVSRLITAVLEQHHDDKGIVWTRSTSPYDIHIIPVNSTDDVIHKANFLHDLFTSNGIEPLLDDRDVSAGVKFKDADLIGIPVKLIISERSLAKECVEFELRKDGSKVSASLGEELQIYASFG